MTTQQIELNNQINQTLQAARKLAESLDARGQHEAAIRVLAITSEISQVALTISGLTDALKAFWQDKKALAADFS